MQEPFPKAPPHDDASVTEAGPELPDRLLSKLKVEVEGYQLLERLGAGGQATVYRARRLKDDRIVAIKILHAGPHADEHARARLRRETQALLALRHPNIVHAIAAGRTRSGLECLVMNYIDGRPLDSLWESEESAAELNPGCPDSRLRLFKQICDTVQTAHRKGITHRDLSPSNILIDKRGQPHILDFGMASTAFNNLLGGGRDITVTGQFIGKIKYASPEQARGAGGRGSENGEADIRSDVYALGVILYQLLTNGAFPYEVVGNVIDVLNNIIHSKPRRPSEVLKGAALADASRHAKARPEASAATPSTPLRRNPPLVNETIEAIVLKALEKDPDKRYQSAGELAADIDHYLAGRPTSAGTWTRNPSTTVTPRPFRPINRAWAFIVTTILLGAVVMMNLRTIVAWFGLSAAATAPLVVAPVASAQEEGSERRLQSLATDLARCDARIRAVNAQLAAVTPRKPPESDERKGGSGILSAADFCVALAKSAAATDRKIAFDLPDAEDLAREEQAEAARVEREMNEDALLKRRAELDAERTALWARLAWGAFSGRDEAVLYRYQLKAPIGADDGAKARIRIVESGVKARRLTALALDAAATALRPSADGKTDKTAGLGETLTTVSEQLRAALANFHKATGDALDKKKLQQKEIADVKALRELAGSLRDVLKGACESQENAARAADELARFQARGKLQKDLRDTADAAARFDAQLVAFTNDAAMEVDTDSKRAEVKLPTIRPPAVAKAKKEQNPEKGPPPKKPEEKADPLALWTVGSRWINSTPNKNAVWTVRSRTRDRLEISRENNKSTGITVVQMSIKGDGTLTVTNVFHRGDRGSSRDRNGRGKGTITSQTLSVHIFAESSSDNGRTWNQWDENLNLTAE